MTITPLILDSYLAFIKNSVGSKMFRAFYAKVDGKKKEITEKGNLGCALYASFILRYFDLIKAGHVTVSGLVRDMEQSGWRKGKTPKPGDVLVWEAMADRDDPNYSCGHQHIGFYIGKDKAISNISSKGMPGITHWTFGKRKGRPNRMVTAIYRHPRLK